MDIFLITFPGKTRKVYVGKAHDAQSAYTHMQTSSRRGGNKKIDGALRYYAGYSKLIVLFRCVPAGNVANALEWASMARYNSCGTTGYNEVPRDVPDLSDPEFKSRWHEEVFESYLHVDMKAKLKSNGFNPKAREKRLNSLPRKHDLDRK